MQLVGWVEVVLSIDQSMRCYRQYSNVEVGRHVVRSEDVSLRTGVDDRVGYPP